jgi:hypothetical protein
MKAMKSRRSMLAGAGHVAAASMLGQWLPAARAGEAVQAQQGQAGGICMTMLFEQNPRAEFDHEKYAANHMPLLREVYGDSVERIELRVTGTAFLNSNQQTVQTYDGRFAVLASTTFWISDVTAFGQKLSAANDRINKDLDGIAKGNRLVQLNRVVLSLGAARDTVKAADLLYAMYFLPVTNPSDVPTFDQGFFVETYLPGLYSMFGPGGVHRLEAIVGVDQGGRKAAQTASFQVFVGEAEAFNKGLDRANAEMSQVRIRDFTRNTMLLVTNMRVRSIV